MKIKELFIRIRLLFNFGFIKFDFLDAKTDKLIEYINKKIKDLSVEENIEIKTLTFEELNKGKIAEDAIAGCFVYLPKDIGAFREIRVYDNADVWTLLHELGHYFIYKRDGEQTEKNADMFTEEFFNNYLPPFFKWVFQINLNVRCDTKRNFTSLECYYHLQEYKKFIKTLETPILV